MAKPTPTQVRVLTAMATGAPLDVDPTYNPASGPSNSGHVILSGGYVWAGLRTWEVMAKRKWISGRKRGWNSNGQRWRFRITRLGRAVLREAPGAEGTERE